MYKIYLLHELNENNAFLIMEMRYLTNNYLFIDSD